MKSKQCYKVKTNLQRVHRSMKMTSLHSAAFMMPSNMSIDTHLLLELALIQNGQNCLSVLLATYFLVTHGRYIFLCHQCIAGQGIYAEGTQRKYSGYIRYKGPFYPIILQTIICIAAKNEQMQTSAKSACCLILFTLLWGSHTSHYQCYCFFSYIIRHKNDVMGGGFYYIHSIFCY